VPLALLAGLVFVNALDNPFVYDDLVTVVGNPSIRELGNLKAIVLHDVFRPVVNLSYAVDHALWGLEPFGFHVTNVLLHMANVVLLFVVALGVDRDWRRLQGLDDHGGAVTALMAGALYAVHPVMTEAVGYVSGRSELLCTLFLLLGMISLRRFLLAGGWRPLAGGLLCFGLATASKETGAMLPVLMLAYDHLLLDGQGRRTRVLRLHLPLVGFVLLAGGLRVAVYLGVEQGGLVQDLWHNALVEAVAVWRYPALLVLPVGQSLVHSARTIESVLDPAFLASAVAFALLLVGLWRLRTKAPIEVFGVVWFLLLTAPSHAIPLQEAVAEHRIYAASGGLFLAAASAARRLGAWAATRSLGPRWAGASIVLVVVAVLAALTVARNRVWADPVTLWADAARKAPDTWAANYGLAEAQRQAGRCPDALPSFRRAIGLLPDRLEPYLNAGICEAELGRFDEARRLFEAVLARAPGNPKALNNLGTLAAREGRYDVARDRFLNALESDPANIRSRQLLAQLYELAFGDAERALQLCREIESLAPGTPGVAECLERNARRVSASD
jgi:tetratricopeptide (TPR) repeat protein